MKATIKIFADGTTWNYGTYDFNTTEQKDKVNEIAEKLKTDKSIDVEVEESEEK